MKTQKLIRLFALILAVLTCAATFAACSSKEEAKYNDALALIEQGDYEAARALFTELGDYKESALHLSRFYYVPTTESSSYTDLEGMPLEDEDNTIVYTYNEQNLPEKVVTTFKSGKTTTALITYNENGDWVSRVYTDEDGSTMRYDYFYDQNGNPAKEVFTDADGSIGTFEYTCNEQGQVLSLLTTNYPDYYPSYTFTYDEQGREILCIFEGEDVTYNFETFYNEDGSIDKYVITDKNGDVCQLEDHEYNEKGLKTKISLTYNTLDDYTCEIEFVYNDKDQLVSETGTYSTGLTYHDSHTYDENGNKATSTYDYSDLGSSVHEFEYKLVYVPYDYTEQEWKDILAGKYFQ